MGCRGCKTARCSCVIQGEAGISLSGQGSERSPYRIERDGSDLYIEPGANVEVVGTGSEDDPFEISGFVERLPLSVRVEKFDTPGIHTWTRLPGETWVYGMVIGAGGGGGQGESTSAASGNIYSGWGGAGGAINLFEGMLDIIGSSATVEVGSGGLGGGLSAAALGEFGEPGGYSSFAAFTAGGGDGGGRFYLDPPPIGGAGMFPGGSFRNVPLRFTSEPWQNDPAHGQGHTGRVGGRGGMRVEGSVYAPVRGQANPVVGLTSNPNSDGKNPLGVIPSGAGTGGSGGVLWVSGSNPHVDGWDGGCGSGGGGGAAARTGSGRRAGYGGRGGDGMVVVVSW